MFEHYLSLLVKATFIENMALAFFLGMCSFIAISKKVENAIGLGIAVTFVLGITCPLNQALNELLLDKGAVFEGVAHGALYMPARRGELFSPHVYRFLEGNRWKALHDRDRHRCDSPVCKSRSATNHHVRYRAHGGGDEPENQITLCEFCHLDGEHGGRLRVRGTASKPEWWIGRTPVMHIEGREVRLR